MKTIKDIAIKDKTFLVRVDYNVPLDHGRVRSDLRIRASLPTLEYLRDHGAAKIILISHLGRPDDTPDAAFSLKPVADVLNQLIGHVSFVPAVSGTTVETSVKSLKNGDILLLENLRFYPGEKQNDPNFIKDIINSVCPDYYIEDAFAVLHRAHASTDAVKSYLPIYAGLLVEHEVDNLQKALSSPERPLLLILGGAKVEDKTPLIDYFKDTADHILIGGKIAADGYQPADDTNITVATDFDEDNTGAKLDIGPVSTADFANHIVDAKTVIWNGVLGKVEDPAYATASTIIAELLGEADDKTTIICGGDTTGFVESLIADHDHLHYTLISTGGGASLEYLSGKSLPGLNNITK